MTVNSYVLEGPDGWILVDTGWDANEALRLLEDHLATRGANWSVIDLVLVTHLHPDHFGLIGLTQERGHAKLAYHLLESQFMQPRFLRFEEWEQQMFAWDRMNGWPSSEAFPRSPSVLAVLEKFKAPNRISSLSETRFSRTDVTGCARCGLRGTPRPLMLL